MPQSTAVRIETTPKRIRALLGGHTVVDTDRTLLVWSDRPYPAYFVPIGDVRGDLLPGGRIEATTPLGAADERTLRLLDLEVKAAARRFPEGPEVLRDYVRLRWDAVDHWFEEDEEVFVHPRDPYKRVDVQPSSRHVRIEVDGVEVAASTRPTLLFETGLVARTYLPALDVRRDVLLDSDTVTRCPYKGTAHYYHVQVGEQRHDDLVWSYRFPARESAPIAGLLAFDDARVDRLVDGELQPRPTGWFRDPTPGA